MDTWGRLSYYDENTAFRIAPSEVMCFVCSKLVATGTKSAGWGWSCEEGRDSTITQKAESVKLRQ